MSNCCELKTRPVPAGLCPTCRAKGKAVSSETSRALLVESARLRLGSGPHFYCPSPTCEVVYYSMPTDAVFRKDEIRVRVGQKEITPPTTVCYCFGHTVESIDEEVRATGRSTVLERIKAKVKAGACRCETENPQGSCCLGNVARIVQEIAGVRGAQSAGSGEGT